MGRFELAPRVRQGIRNRLPMGRSSVGGGSSIGSMYTVRNCSPMFTGVHFPATTRVVRVPHLTDTQKGTVNPYSM